MYRLTLVIYLRPPKGGELSRKEKEKCLIGSQGSCTAHDGKKKSFRQSFQAFFYFIFLGDLGTRVLNIHEFGVKRTIDKAGLGLRKLYVAQERRMTIFFFFFGMTWF